MSRWREDHERADGSYDAEMWGEAPAPAVPPSHQLDRTAEATIRQALDLSYQAFASIQRSPEPFDLAPFMRGITDALVALERLVGVARDYEKHREASATTIRKMGEALDRAHAENRRLVGVAKAAQERWEKEQRMLADYKRLTPDAKTQIMLHSYAASLFADILAPAALAATTTQEPPA